MRAECAETKVAAECKLAEACSMMEEAQKKFTEAEVKLHAAESMQIEANRFRHVAERKLHEVEAREDDLRRRIETSKSEYVFNLSHLYLLLDSGLLSLSFSSCLFTLGCPWASCQHDLIQWSKILLKHLVP